jgi:hypothetical protein
VSAGGPSSSRDARAARIHELELALFGRPGSRAEDALGSADQETALAELTRLRALTDSAPDEEVTLVGHNPDGQLGEDDSADSGVRPQDDVDRTPVSPVPLRALGIIGIVLLVAGVAIGVVSSPPRPAALDALSAPARPLDVVRSDALRDAGLPLLGDGRVLADDRTGTLVAFRAPRGTEVALREDDACLVGSEAAPYGGVLYRLPAPTALDRADTRRSEVCAWVVERRFAIEGRCTTLDEFAQEGLVFETERFGIRYAVAWSPAGEAELRALPAEGMP